MSERAIADYDFVRRIAALPFVEAIWLFGSRARGDNRPRSDIDLAVECPAATSAEWRRIDDIVENADTLLKIDCLRLDGFGPDHYVWQALRRDGKLLYRKAEA